MLGHGEDQEAQELPGSDVVKRRAVLTVVVFLVDGYDEYELHAPQIQGFFNIPVDHLLGVPMLSSFLKERIGDETSDYVVVSPDLGSVTRARNFAARIGCPLAIVDKRRQKANVCEVMNIIGDVKGKKVILVDDMIDTAGTLCNAASAIIEKGGASEVTACVTSKSAARATFSAVNSTVIWKPSATICTCICSPKQSVVKRAKRRLSTTRNGLQLGLYPLPRHETNYHF